MLTLALSLLLQAPGDGWAIDQIPPRQVKTLYWELFDTSETWVSLIPADAESGPPLVRLVFQACRPGKQVSRPPDRLVLRALGLPLTIVTRYSLRFRADRDSIDLGGACDSPSRPGPSCQLLYPVGENSSANGVSVDIEPRVLRELAAAKVVTGVALGFPVVLSPQDLLAVRSFKDAAGVTAQP